MVSTMAQPKTKIMETGEIQALKRKLKFSKRLNYITNSINSAKDVDHILIHLSHKILTLFRPKGCPKCQDTGYKGRTGIHELLVASPEIKSSIQSTIPVGELKKQAIMCGMTTLMQDGIRKVFEGLTDMKQVRKVCL